MFVVPAAGLRQRGQCGKDEWCPSAPHLGGWCGSLKVVICADAGGVLPSRTRSDASTVRRSLCAEKGTIGSISFSGKRRPGASLRRESTNTKRCAGPARLRTPYRLNYHVCGKASDRSPAIEQRLGGHECAWSHCAKPTVKLGEDRILSCLAVTDT